jgi:hypothetical protein
MLDKFTFGANPAALYLVEVLNTINNKKLNRKITNLIRESRTTLRELLEANEVGKMSTHTVSVLVELLRKKVEVAAHSMKYNENKEKIESINGELAVNLMENIIKGELKSLHRRARRVHHLEKDQQRAMAQKDCTGVISADGILLGRNVIDFEPVKIVVKKVPETITADTLQNKSRAKLTRLQKPCKLY